MVSFEKKESFFDILLHIYKSRRDMNFDQIRKLIENQYSTPEDRSEMYKIIERFCERLATIDPAQDRSNEEVKDLLKSYKEEILGDKKREYDMSSLINPKLIASVNNDKKVEDIKYKPKSSEINLNANEIKNEVTLINSHQEKVTVKPIGTLYYKEGTIENDVTHYEVTFGEGDSKRSYQVFSEINFNKLTNEGGEYKELVTEDLLSENNINLSNAGNYIGTIRYNPISPNNLRGAEQKDTNGYSYQAGVSYELYYDAAALTAATCYTRRKEEEELSEKNKQLNGTNATMPTAENKTVGNKLDDDDRSI